ncbi:MAG: porin family protein [Saprospiraceae bacterium]
MKKLFLLPVLFAFTTFLHAQISGIGIRPGVTLSTYKLSRNWSDLYDASLRPGASVAGFVEFNLGNRFTVQPEVAFTQRGASIRSETGLFWDGPEFGYPTGYRVTEDRFKETLNYLDVPVMFEKNFGGGRIGAYVAAGPGLSFGFGGKGREEVTVEYPTANEAVDTRTDPSDYTIEMGKGRYDLYKGFDFNLNLGGGLLWIMDSGELGLDLRYTHGLKMLSADGLKNRNLLIGLSYMYYLGQ